MDGAIDRIRQSELTAGVVQRIPPAARKLVPLRVKKMLVPPAPQQLPLPSLGYISSLKAYYQVANLVGVSPGEFQRRIEEFLSLDDAAMEGYQSSDQQRGRSVRFEWSEDHDFGDFQVKGMAQNRSSWLISMFMDQLSALQRDLTGKRVLDIGCWTGGTSLIMARMGASVVAIEEVKKYVDCLEYLCDSFGVTNLEARNLSLYDLTADEFQDAFDIVLFGGVLYHLSDPVLGARITFDALREPGTCLLETAVARSKERILEYAGKDEPGRGDGANWFFPAPNVVHAIMDEVGYRDIRGLVCPQAGTPQDRMLAVGTKVAQVDMLRAGLSVPGIR